MLRSRCALAALAIVFTTATVKADSVDPYIRIGDPNAGTPVGLIFSFSSDANGGGVFNFVNATGQNITDIDFFVTLPGTDVITCVPADFFSTCSYTSTPRANGKALYDIGAETGGEGIGIPLGVSFSINLNNPINGEPNPDPMGAGGWGPNNLIEVGVNGSDPFTPEPATWGLLLAGAIGATIARTRRRCK